jgi:hypothetical protein
MWYSDFADRLESWSDLRAKAQTLELEPALHLINQWWDQAPWKSYYLHWDDQPTWPDPWELLSDNVYCELAKALGILYTISMLDRADMADAEVVLTDEGYNLVRVAKEKYILNWNPESIVNTHQGSKIIRRFAQSEVKQ